MAETPTPVAPVLVTTANTDTTIYTVPASTTTILHEAALVNVTSTPIIVTFGFGATTADARDKALAPSVTIQGNDSWPWGGWFPLATTWVVNARCNTANALVVHIGILQVT